VVLPCPLIPDTILTIETFGGKKDQRADVRVVRSTLESFAYFHGCEFIAPLSEDQLRTWVQG